jgi:hypothetical protein
MGIRAQAIGANRPRDVPDGRLYFRHLRCPLAQILNGCIEVSHSFEVPGVVAGAELDRQDLNDKGLESSQCYGHAEHARLARWIVMADDRVVSMPALAVPRSSGLKYRRVAGLVQGRTCQLAATAVPLTTR